jgi:hypothetical protein
MLGGGFRRQDLVILAGDVGSGKSALALGMAIRAARTGTPALLLSGEAAPERVLERALALEGKASVDDLRQGRLDATARAAVARRGAAADVPLALSRSWARASRSCGRGGDGAPRGLVVTAPAGLPRPAARLEERVALVVRALKAIALEYDVALLATAPLPGSADGPTSPHPDDRALGAASTPPIWC